MSALRDRLPRGDEGSLLPMLLLCWLILAVLVGAFAAASSAFLAQRDLQATCDQAAVYAAGSVDPDLPSSSDRLRVASAVARESIDKFLGWHHRDDPTLSARVEVDDQVLTVSCRRKAKIIFGALIGRGDGIDRKTESSVRSPLRDARQPTAP